MRKLPRPGLKRVRLLTKIRVCYFCGAVISPVQRVMRLITPDFERRYACPICTRDGKTLE
jgi:hypothetical protein